MTAAQSQDLDSDLHKDLELANEVRILYQDQANITRILDQVLKDAPFELDMALH
jgi:hypothetical protein